MWNKIVAKYTVASAILFIMSGAVQAQEVWVAKDGSIRSSNVKAMLIDRGDFYLATRNEVYRTKDVKDKWESVFALPSGTNEINCIGGRANNIFIGTKRGLFKSQDYGRTWKNVFRTIIPEKNNVICVEVSKHNPKKILIATGGGIFLSEDSGERWQDISGSLKNKRIDCIALNKESIYATSDEGLYIRRQDSSGWERLFIRSATEENSEDNTEDGTQTESEEAEGSSANCIAIKGNRIYIGLDNKILFSESMGREWRSLSRKGMAGAVNYILPSAKSDKLYSATTKGVFEFAPDKAEWHELYDGMEKRLSAEKLIFDGEGETSLWAVTNKGLYRLEDGRYIGEEYIDVERNLKGLKVIFDNEPAFRELQQAAIKFAEVSPDKIKDWRRESRMRALLPKVSFGIDRDRSSSSEIYTSASRDYVVVGPDDVSDGFDVSISWELGDLVWSDDQTNIDVRSRLTTQLRNDILDDLRRTYYERRRLQFELMYNAPKDVKTRFEKEMRIQELTQAIDDLTGNYLSEHTKK